MKINHTIYSKYNVVINWFIIPINGSYLRIINQSYWSHVIHVHQLCYRMGDSHCINELYSHAMGEDLEFRGTKTITCRTS